MALQLVTPSFLLQVINAETTAAEQTAGKGRCAVAHAGQCQHRQVFFASHGQWPGNETRSAAEQGR